MSQLGRESGNGIEVMQVARQGTVQEITIDAAETVAFVDIGLNPDASTGTRFRISPDFAEYFAVKPGEKVAASGSATAAVAANAMGADTTMVRIFYDQTAGKVEVMEAGLLDTVL